mmetsp:Transcript_23150/g.72544  ORF Transcript_23150/g.72544 Transcript_23150/m.72544 type:complete len:204 (-) Transcript_23150:127-738(-)
MTLWTRDINAKTALSGTTTADGPRRAARRSPSLDGAVSTTIISAGAADLRRAVLKKAKTSSALPRVMTTSLSWTCCGPCAAMGSSAVSTSSYSSRICSMTFCRNSGTTWSSDTVSSAPKSPRLGPSTEPAADRREYSSRTKSETRRKTFPTLNCCGAASTRVVPSHRSRPSSSAAVFQRQVPTMDRTSATVSRADARAPVTSP